VPDLLDPILGQYEVDPKRLGCVRLSVGGYRSFHLAALDRRIKVAVDVGWMSSFASHIRRHVLNTIGLSFHLVGVISLSGSPGSCRVDCSSAPCS
jgi:hypothetical protein